jgi:nicotinate-nucleotide pyrophosphorylase
VDATAYAKILAYCKAHGSITVREAVIFCGINSPRKAISDMRRKGYEVTTVRTHMPKEDGSRVYYNRYFIKEREADNGGV